MRYIKKTDTTSEESGINETKKYIENCWNSDSKIYINLSYDGSNLKDLKSILVNEQCDDSNNCYCCYCMRKLYLHNTEDGHNANVTLEHIIPNKITKYDWEKDKSKYQSFQNLDANHLSICYKGELTDSQKETKITEMPFPHFVSYHNLVASCDGKTYEKRKMCNSHCCNNNRQERFVSPIFLKQELADGIQYQPNGKLDFDDSIYDDEWFDRNHLNLQNEWITLVRKFWYRIAMSEYTDIDIESARQKDKTESRTDILDDIDPKNDFSSWDINETAWNLLSEYSWFYQYYKKRYFPV